jgi:CRP-like cAMP-binding protein
MVLGSVQANQVIFLQGSNGSYFYVIKKGTVDLYINDNYIKSLTAGESFGDLALLHDAKRSGTIISSEYTEMWCLERKKFRNIIEYINIKNYEENKNFLQSISILSKICLIR